MNEIEFEGWEITEDTDERVTATGPEGKVTATSDADTPHPWDEWELTVQADGETVKDGEAIRIGDPEEVYDQIEDAVAEIVSDGDVSGY